MENSFIKVIDNFLPPLIQNNIESILFSNRSDVYENMEYRFLNNLTGTQKEKIEYGIGNTFCGEGKMFASCEPLLAPLYILSYHENFLIKKIIQARTFISFPDPNPRVLTPHIDYNYPHYVLLYYTNDSDGDTIIYKNKETLEILEKVSPRKGRALLFDGRLWHAGSVPSTKPRSVINYNFNVLNLKS